VNAATGRIDIAARLELQAHFCGEMGSPLYQSMFRSASQDYREGGPLRRIFDEHAWLARASTPGLRIMGAVHYDALTGAAIEVAAHFPSCGGDGDAAAAWRSARDWIEAHAEPIALRAKAAPQTNEVARSMPLLGGALALAAHTAMPLRLLEAGSSAGLNARFDRYRYAGDGWAWGDPNSPLELRNHVAGGRPRHLDATLKIQARAACDLHPLDIARDADRATLRSYVWPDQLARFDRLNRAIEAAASVPLVVEQADMFDWIPRNAAPSAGVATVLMHSVMLEHLDPSARGEFVTAVEALGERARADAPFGWLRMELEGDGYATRVTRWPGRVETEIATSDGHAQHLVWADSRE
jgi:hypothetical protein